MPLTIQSATGRHKFAVKVAATPQEQEQGLMFYRSLRANHGMIFPYDPPQDVSFWMKNTLIPLDMVFIRADGTIARITTAKALERVPNCPDQGDRCFATFPSGEPVAAVLEIRGGRAAELGIRAGDRVRWPH